MAELSKETEQQVMEFQQLQGQLQMVVMQKSQLKAQADEMDSALEGLKTAQGKVYRSAGMVLVESTKAELTKEFAEKKESMLVRMQALGKQEEKVRQRLIELRGKIEAATKGMKGAG